MTRLIPALAVLLAWGSFSQERPATNNQETKPDGNSTIVFFREAHYTGSGLRPSVYIDGRDVGRLSNGRWFSRSVEPGKHKLQSSAKNQPATVVTLEPGQTAYVQMVTVAGVWRGGGRLIEVDGEEAQKVIARLKPNDEAEKKPK